MLFKAIFHHAHCCCNSQGYWFGYGHLWKFYHETYISHTTKAKHWRFSIERYWIGFQSCQTKGANSALHVEGWIYGINFKSKNLLLGSRNDSPWTWKKLPCTYSSVLSTIPSTFFCSFCNSECNLFYFVAFMNYKI